MMVATTAAQQQISSAGQPVVTAKYCAICWTHAHHVNACYTSHALPHNAHTRRAPTLPRARKLKLPSRADCVNSLLVDSHCVCVCVDSSSETDWADRSSLCQVSGGACSIAAAAIQAETSTSLMRSKTIIACIRRSLVDDIRLNMLTESLYNHHPLTVQSPSTSGVLSVRLAPAHNPQHIIDLNKLETRQCSTCRPATDSFSAQCQPGCRMLCC